MFQTDDKGILTDEELLKIATQAEVNHPEDGSPDIGQSIRAAFRAIRDDQHQATIDHLAGVKDEELVALLDSFEVDIDCQDGESLRWSTHHGGLQPDSARTILARILPILSARFEKDKQEAVEKAKHEQAAFDQLNFDKERKVFWGKIEQARIEERKAIGEKLSWILQIKPSEAGSFAELLKSGAPFRGAYTTLDSESPRETKG